VRVTWQRVKQSGSRPSPRCSCSLAVTAPNLALMFGGVYDEVCTVRMLLLCHFNDIRSQGEGLMRSGPTLRAVVGSWC